MSLTDPTMLAILFAVFTLAGLVKGVIGLGLPTVSLALLVLVTDLTGAMALMLVPSFVTNVWQGAVGGHFVTLWRRLWLFFGLATLTVWIGGRALSTVEPQYLLMLLGAILIVYGVLNLTGRRFAIPPKHVSWSGAVLGTVNGVLAGMTGTFVVPGVMYLQALGLARDQLIQAMGILFTLSTAALAVTLQDGGFLTSDLGFGSVFGILPALLGMTLGQRLRRRMRETTFRHVFFISVTILGAAIALKAGVF